MPFRLSSHRFTSCIPLFGRDIMDELKERDWEIRCWVLGNLYRPDAHLQEDMGFK